MRMFKITIEDSAFRRWGEPMRRNWERSVMPPNDQAEAQCPGEKGNNATKPN